MAGQIKNWQESLLLELGERLIPFGFDPKAKGQAFYRKFDWGRQAVFVCFIRHVDDVDITASIGVRFDAVEDLVSEFETSPLVAKKDKQARSTAGCELGNLSGEGQHRWTIANDADVRKVADGFMEKLKAIGLPKLEELSSLKRVLEILSGDDEAASLYSPINEYRAMGAVAAAFVLQDRERCLELIEKKTRFFEGRDDFPPMRFWEMVRVMRERLG